MGIGNRPDHGRDRFWRTGDPSFEKSRGRARRMWGEYRGEGAERVSGNGRIVQSEAVKVKSIRKGGEMFSIN